MRLPCPGKKRKNGTIELVRARVRNLRDLRPASAAYKPLRLGKMVKRDENPIMRPLMIRIKLRENRALGIAHPRRVRCDRVYAQTEQYGHARKRDNCVKAKPTPGAASRRERSKPEIKNTHQRHSFSAVTVISQS
jgi:hypothetical protein